MSDASNSGNNTKPVQKTARTRPTPSHPMEEESTDLEYKAAKLRKKTTGQTKKDNTLKQKARAATAKRPKSQKRRFRQQRQGLEKYCCLNRLEVNAPPTDFEYKEEEETDSEVDKNKPKNNCRKKNGPNIDVVCPRRVCGPIRFSKPNSK
jgi:hypothetical protein